MGQFIKINSADNVAVALSNVTAGEECRVGDVIITTREDIPAGHKMALCDLSEGEDVVKYGFPIGHLLKAVAKGGLIDHNILKTNLSGII